MQNATFDINLELEVDESPKTEAWEDDDTTIKKSWSRKFYLGEKNLGWMVGTSFTSKHVVNFGKFEGKAKRVVALFTMSCT